MALKFHSIGGRVLDSSSAATTTATAEMYGAPMLSSLHVSVSTPRLIADHKNIKPAINVVAESNSRARARARTRAVNDGIISAIASSDPAQAEVTWQIVAGALAGVAPFVVAGIEFSKRIVEQKNCKVCRGSGLVLRDNKYYFRCPRCGGFLPWQSWRRFFTG